MLGTAIAALVASLTISEGDEWGRPLRADWRKYVCRSGSILDVSKSTKPRPVDETGRVIINGDGHFAFEHDPTNAVRFLCCPATMGLGGAYPNLNSRGLVSAYVREMSKRGYNMIRWHMASALSYGVEREGEYCAAALDTFDWLLKCCRENGVYVQMNIHEGYMAFGPWKYDEWGNRQPFDYEEDESYLVALYFSEKARANWLDACRRMLCHENKYTGIRPVDDSCLLLLEGQNEQEFAFNYHPMSERKKALMVGPYREYLRSKYQGISDYNARWDTDYSDFDDIPCFGNANDLKSKNADVNEFLYAASVHLARFYVDSVRKMGFRGYMTNFDFVKHLAYHFIRRPLDYVGMHIYHDHPIGSVCNGSGSNRQTSCIAGGNSFFRELIATRLVGKPLVCSEYDQPFWNRYRYERAYMCPAYASFHGVDSISCWQDACSRRDIGNDSIWNGGVMTPFKQHADPLGIASEFLSWALYRRGDVAATASRVRIVETRAATYAANPLSAPAPAQTALALVTGLVHDPVESENEIRPAADGELVLPAIGGGRMRMEMMFTESMDSLKDVSGAIGELKRRGLLPAGNLSDGKSVFQSSTGELALDVSARKMTVNTPRFQGLAAPAGTCAALQDLEIVSHSRDGSISLVAMDGLKPISCANRLLLVRLTNALNSGMRFKDADMKQVEDVGTIPVLLQHSVFEIRIRHAHAPNLRLRSLNLEGSDAELPEVRPLSVEGGVATFRVDTHEHGNTTFYEIRDDREMRDGKTN